MNSWQHNSEHKEWIKRKTQHLINKQKIKGKIYADIKLQAHILSLPRKSEVAEYYLFTDHDYIFYQNSLQLIRIVTIEDAQFVTNSKMDKSSIKNHQNLDRR